MRATPETKELARLDSQLFSSASSTYSRAPPSYRTNATPSLRSFATTSTVTPSHSVPPVPTVQQCITHLRLLNVFHALREEISSKDGLFELWDKDVAGREDSEGLLQRMREKRWQVYVTRATVRFEVWLQKMWMPNRSRIVVWGLVGPSYLSTIPERAAKEKLEWTVADLPPIDLLMVWHAYFLHPRDLLEDSLRDGRLGFWAAGFPWDVIETCLEGSILADPSPPKPSKTSYNPPKFTSDRFEGVTGRHWSNLQDPGHHELKCPRCKASNFCPWTAGLSSVITPTAFSEGFADASFRTHCIYCETTISHNVLTRQQFGRYMEALIEDNVPIPGTLFTPGGMPPCDAAKHTSVAPKKPSLLRRHFPIRDSADAHLVPVQRCPMFLPHRLMQYPEISDRLQSIVQPSRSLDQPPDRIQHVFSAALSTPSILKAEAKVSSAKQLPAASRIAIRRLLRRYTEANTTGSPFAVDLVGAVIRQGAFIDKMHALDWVSLPEPRLRTTMEQLLRKYTRFFALMAAHPNRTAVPTLDVDLAWHTHQLEGMGYYVYSTRMTPGTFIDHDDKIAESALNDAFSWTCEAYEKMFGEPYATCACAYCSDVRARAWANVVQAQTNDISAIPPARKSRMSLRPWSSSRNEKQPLVRSTPVPVHQNEQPPPYSFEEPGGNHISSHNAIRPPDPNASDAFSRMSLRGQARGHRRRRRNLRRDDSPDNSTGTGGGGGGVVIVPGPALSDPCITPGLYVCNPACGSGTCTGGDGGAAGGCVVAGAVGSCASCVGTGGGCAGGSSGGCSGGSTGGCGGSGGSSGGGCGSSSGGGCGGGGGGCGGGGGGCGGGG